MKIDSKGIFNKADSMDFPNVMESKENCVCDDDDDGCYIVAEITRKKWNTLPTMARKSIHKGHHETIISHHSSNTKLDTTDSVEIIDPPYLYDVKEVEMIKPLVTSNSKKSVVEVKTQNIPDRIFKTCRTTGNSSSANKSRGASFQSNMKKRLNFLRESYRLAEKYQYRQLLQSLTNRTTTLFSSVAQAPSSPRVSKAPIPLIDLTKEKNCVIVDRSREDVPWTSCTIKENNSVESNSSTKNQIPRINSFGEYLKTNPATEEDVVQQILSCHTKASSEKRKQAALETAKLEILSDSNRRAYENVLEERLKTYMRITSPALIESELEGEDYKLPKLTSDQESQINRALMPSPSGQILVEKFGLQIKRRDMQTLKGLNWLNDEVINFYMNLIMERGKNSNLPKVYAFNTFFYPKLISNGHASLKRWTKKVDIFSYDLVLVPVHLGMHWCMSLIDFRSREVRYYDSMGSTNTSCLQALLSYLEDESLDKKNTPYSTADWKKKNVKDIPQQMNGSDCGVFSCMFAEHLSRDTPILFTQDNMPYFRRKMVLEILEGKLLT